MNNSIGTQAPEVAVSRDTLQKLKQIVVEIAQLKLAPEEISNTANLFNDCGMDSVSIVELVLSLEGQFDITIDEDELEASIFQDFSRLGAFVESKLQVAA
jgi:acyl carrier protein